MLGNLTAWVLNTYLGEYVEDFDASHLTIGLLQGRYRILILNFQYIRVIKI